MLYSELFRVIKLKLIGVIVLLNISSINSQYCCVFINELCQNNSGSGISNNHQSSYSFRSPNKSPISNGQPTK